MRIEDELNQKRPFRNGFHRASVNLIFTSNWLAGHIRSTLKPYDITLQQYNVLRILKGAGKPISTSCIRGRMIERMADTSRLVERLCSKEWVNRESCCSDKRRVDITISEKGLKLLEDIDASVNMVGAMDANLSDEEALLLSELLDKLRG